MLSVHSQVSTIPILTSKLDSASYFAVVYKLNSLFLGHLFDTYHRPTNADTSSTCNIANYDVIAASVRRVGLCIASITH